MSLTELNHMKKRLKRCEEIRMQDDLDFSIKVKDEYEKLIVEKNHLVEDLKIDQSIRRGEATVSIWATNFLPFGLTQNGARVIRDAKLAELTMTEDAELKTHQDEFLRCEKEADERNTRDRVKVEKQRSTEDRKVARYISRLSDRPYHDVNIMGQIIEVDRMIDRLRNPPAPAPLAPAFVEDDGEVSGKVAGTGSHGTSDRKTCMIVFGMSTPDNTPPSSSEPRFGTFEQQATPTQVPKTVDSRRRALPNAGQFRVGPSAAAVTTKETALPAAQDVVAESGLTKVVIDLESDSDDDLPAPKRRHITSHSGEIANAVQATPGPSTAFSKGKARAPKRTAKKPILQAFDRTPATPKIASPLSSPPARKLSTTFKTVNSPAARKSTPPVSLALIRKSSSQTVRNKLEPIPKTASVRAKSPDFFDTDSDYTETEHPSKAKKNRSISLEHPRSRSGKLLKGDLLHAPGLELSPAKGISYKNWARRVYFPQKPTGFGVKLVWTHRSSGRFVSSFDDDTDALGFYYRRRAHTFFPVIGHASKEAENPEYVLEEDELKHVQYNSEFALVCVTRNVGVQNDVVVQFASRAELWDFLLVCRVEMGVRIIENLSLRFDKELLA